MNKEIKIKGYAYQDNKTKKLVERIPPKAIAVIVHQDIDMVAAENLIFCKVKAVINLRKSMSGDFLHNGVETLMKANIPVFDIKDQEVKNLNQLFIMIKDNELYCRNNDTWEKLCSLKRYTFREIEQLKKEAYQHFPKQFKSFVGNSLYYSKKELDLFVKEVQSLPTLRQFLGKEVLIVARGANYEKDLLFIKQVLKKKNMIKIAVDGGADGLLKIGVSPDFIVGDMDSVSEKALKSGAQLLVHTYKDGRSPGEKRVRLLHLPYKKMAFLGTSEDVAIIFAYCSGSKRIYTVGTRLGMNEFLEKGRIGMGSSLLTRMKVSHQLVDLKGIHTLIDEESNQRFQKFALIPAIILLGLVSFNQRFELFVSLVFQWWGGG